jgi:hypothetical protein
MRRGLRVSLVRGSRRPVGRAASRGSPSSVDAFISSTSPGPARECAPPLIARRRSIPSRMCNDPDLTAKLFRFIRWEGARARERESAEQIVPAVLDGGRRLSRELESARGAAGAAEARAAEEQRQQQRRAQQRRGSSRGAGGAAGAAEAQEDQEAQQRRRRSAQQRHRRRSCQLS